MTMLSYCFVTCWTLLASVQAIKSANSDIHTASGTSTYHETTEKKGRSDNDGMRLSNNEKYCVTQNQELFPSNGAFRECTWSFWRDAGFEGSFEDGLECSCTATNNGGFITFNFGVQSSNAMTLSSDGEYCITPAREFFPANGEFKTCTRSFFSASGFDKETSYRDGLECSCKGSQHGFSYVYRGARNPGATPNRNSIVLSQDHRYCITPDGEMFPSDGEYVFCTPSFFRASGLERRTKYRDGYECSCDADAEGSLTYRYRNTEDMRLSKDRQYCIDPENNYFPSNGRFVSCTRSFFRASGLAEKQHFRNGLKCSCLVTIKGGSWSMEFNTRYS